MLTPLRLLIKHPFQRISMTLRPYHTPGVLSPKDRDAITMNAELAPMDLAQNILLSEPDTHPIVLFDGILRLWASSKFQNGIEPRIIDTLCDIRLKDPLLPPNPSGNPVIVLTQYSHTMCRLMRLSHGIYRSFPDRLGNQVLNNDDIKSFETAFEYDSDLNCRLMDCLGLNSDHIPNKLVELVNKVRLDQWQQRAVHLAQFSATTMYAELKKGEESGDGPSDKDWQKLDDTERELAEREKIEATFRDSITPVFLTSFGISGFKLISVISRPRDGHSDMFFKSFSKRCHCNGRATQGRFAAG